MKRIVVLSAAAVLALACSKESEDDGKKPATKSAPGTMIEPKPPTTKTQAKTAPFTGMKHGVKVEGRYDLAVSQRGSASPSTDVFIMVTDKDLRIGAHRNNINMAKPFPGASIEPGKLVAWLDKRAAMSRRQQHEQEEKSDRTTRWIRTVANDDRIFAGRVSWSQPVWGPSPSAPLLLADKNLAATRLSQVLSSLCGYGGELAVARPGNDKPQAHMVRLGTYEGEGCSTQNGPATPGGDGILPPALPWALGLHLEKNRTTVYLGDKSTWEVDRKPGALGKWIRAAKWSRRYKYRVLISVGLGVTVADVVAAADELSSQAMRHVHLGTDWARAKKAVSERNQAIAASLEKLPHIRLAQVHTTGGLDAAIIHRYLQRQRRAFGRCVAQQAPGGHRRKTGTIKISFTIPPDGYVIQATATGGSARASKCIAALLKQMSFPKPRGGGDVKITNYPITFTFAK